MSIGLVQIFLTVGFSVLFKVAIRKRNTADAAPTASRGGGRGGEGRGGEGRGEGGRRDRKKGEEGGSGEGSEREGKECMEERERNGGKREDKRRREVEEGRERSENIFRHCPQNTHKCKYIVVYPHTEICNKV